MEGTRKTRAFSLAVLVVGVALAIAGCGGGGTSSDAPGDGSIRGEAVKGPVSGSTVTAYGVNANGMRGSMLGSATTDAHGAFTVPIGGYEGPVLVRMSGGTYTDEATGAAVSMGGGDMMTAVIPSVGAGASGAGVRITPLTSMAEAMAERMSGGLTSANIEAANGAVGAYFMVDDIMRTPPMNPLVQGAGSNATQAMKNYGMTLAAIAQYAKNAGMPLSSSMVTSLTADASDGVMDGMGNGSRIMMGGAMMQPDAGTSGLSDAMADFLASGLNRSGVTSAQMAALMQHLSASDGHMR